MDQPVVRLEGLLIGVNRLPLRFLGLLVLALEIQQYRQIVQTRAHLRMLIPQQLAPHRQCLAAQGSGFLVISFISQKRRKVVHRGRQPLVSPCAQISPHPPRARRNNCSASSYSPMFRNTNARLTRLTVTSGCCSPSSLRRIASASRNRASAPLRSPCSCNIKARLFRP